MNGRSWQQQRQRYAPTELLYSSSSPYWMEGAVTPPMLRSSWSSSTTEIHATASTKRQSHTRKQKHSRKSYPYVQNTDQDEEAYMGRQASRSGISTPRKQQHVLDKNFTGAIPKSGTQTQRRRQQQHQNDYMSPIRYDDPQSQPQRQRRASIQCTSFPANAPRPIKNNNSNITKKEINRPSVVAGKETTQKVRKLPSMEKTLNLQLQHHGALSPKDEIQIQRKPIQRQRNHPSLSPPPPPPPITIAMDGNNFHQQQRAGAPTGWKTSGQYDHLVLRSPLSSTPPPSLLDSSSSSSNSNSSNSASSSMTLSYSSETHQSRNINTNGLIYHRKPCSSGGSDKSRSHRQQRHAATTPNPTTAAVSTPLGLQPSRSASTYHRRYVARSPSTHSSGTPSSRHSYEDQQQHYWEGERPRRYSQGDCSINNSRPQPRVSTPKLRRVCSAKPCIHPPTLTTQQKDTDGMYDPFLDVDSLSAAKQQQQQQSDSSGNDRQQQQQQQPVPSFWNPRSTRSVLPVKRTLSRRIRGLLLPQRTKLEDISVSNDQQLASDYQWSLARPTTPTNDISIDNDAILEDQENGVMNNPFYMISQSWDIVDQAGLHFNEDDFVQMDTYATSVQQIGTSLTPQVLSQKFLVRPYRRDLYRLRIIFMWIIQNIGIVDQRGGTSNIQGNETTMMMADTTHQPQPPTTKISLRQRLTSRRNLQAPDQEEDMEMPALDVMHGDGLLPEGGGDVDSFDDWLFSESAQQVLHRRVCTSSIGMANLFCEMATAAGFTDTRVVYGYLRAPKDSIRTASMDLTNDNGGGDDHVTLVQNHAWCYVKVEGEYRFVDCWLASPFQPQNKTKAELSTHWFLTKPTHMIYTHFPQEASDQCLEPTIDVMTFFALPYVWASFFIHHIKMIRYNPDALTLVDDDGVCHLTFRVDPGVACFAFVETDKFNSSSNSNQSSTITMRCLAQSRMIPDEKTGQLERVFKVKAVLPPGHDAGWLKIYAGTSSSNSVSHYQSIHPFSSSSSSTTITTASTRQDNGSSSSSRHALTNNATVPSNDPLPPLVVCFRLTSSGRPHRPRPFEFVHIHPCRHEFYIREPQCYLLYPLQTYNFLVRGDDTHHKLAIKSPGGKLYKLMYYPQEHTYDGSVKISETGKWSLISLLHNAGGWLVVATWECRG